MSSLSQLVVELRRREVFRSTGIYVVASWLVVQVASLIFPAIDVPEAAIRYVWLAALLVFPVAIIFAWLYDVSPSGVSRTPPAQAGDDVDISLHGSDYTILAALAVVVAAISWQLTTNIREAGPVPGLVFIDTAIDPNSIAVLPLDNLSGDPEQQYFVSGMQEALITGLSRVGAFKVTSKTSTMPYRDSDQSLRQIAAQLGVAKLIEGSIFRVNDRVRIDVKLVDAALDEYIWTESFEEDVKDVMLLQNEVAQAVAAQVHVELSPQDQDQLEFSRPVIPAAYEAFLKGQFHLEQFTPQEMALAAQYYEQALTIDPNYALAYYGLARLCGFQAQAGVISPQEANMRCLPPIARALSIDDSLPEAHMGFGSHMTWQKFDWEQGRVGFERAIELNPSYAEAHMFFSHYLTLMGFADEGTAHMQKALELDPLNPFVQGLRGAQLMMIDKHVEAIDQIDSVMATNPGFGFGHIVTWQAHHEMGNHDQAIEAAANHFRFTRGDETGALALEEAYIDGDYEGALLHAAEVLVEHSKTVNVPPMNIGMLFEQAGEIDKAIDWFEVAYENRDPDAPYLGVLTKTEAVHSHPRFVQLLRKMGHSYWADRYSKSGA